VPWRRLWDMSHYEKYGKKYYEKHREKESQRGKAYYAKDPERKQEYYYKLGRERVLKSRYGLSLADYDRMLELQSGACAICGSKSPGDKDANFHVDHCHTTGAVRGLLCNRCNIGLGFFSDDVGRLAKAIEYLHSGVCGI